MPIYANNHEALTIWREGKQVVEVYVFGHRCYAADLHNWTETDTYLYLYINDWAEIGATTGTIRMRRFVEYGTDGETIIACKYVKTESSLTPGTADAVAMNFYFPITYDTDEETGKMTPRGLAGVHYERTPRNCFYWMHPESYGEGLMMSQLERIDTIIYEEGDLNYGEPDDEGNIRLPIYAEYIKNLEGMGIEKNQEGTAIALDVGQAVTVGNYREYQILTDEEQLVSKSNISFPASTGRFPVYAYSTQAGQNAPTTSLTSHVDTHPVREKVNIRMVGWATLEAGVITNVESISNYDGTLATITGDDTGVDGTGGWIRYTTDVHFNRRKRPRRITAPNWRLDVPPIYWGKAQPVGTQTKVTTTVYDYTCKYRIYNDRNWGQKVQNWNGSYLYDAAQAVRGTAFKWTPDRANVTTLPADIFWEIRIYTNASSVQSFFSRIFAAGSEGFIGVGSGTTEDITVEGMIGKKNTGEAYNIASWGEPQVGYYTKGTYSLMLTGSGSLWSGFTYVASGCTLYIDGKAQFRLYIMVAGEGGVQGKVALHVKENQRDGQQTYEYEVYDSYDDMPEDTPYDYYVPIGDLEIEEGSAVGDFTLDPDIMVA